MHVGGEHAFDEERRLIPVATATEQTSASIGPRRSAAFGRSPRGARLRRWIARRRARRRARVLGSVLDAVAAGHVIGIHGEAQEERRARHRARARAVRVAVVRLSFLVRAAARPDHGVGRAAIHALRRDLRAALSGDAGADDGSAAVRRAWLRARRRYARVVLPVRTRGAPAKVIRETDWPAGARAISNRNVAFGRSGERGLRLLREDARRADALSSSHDAAVRECFRTQR